MTEEKIRIVQDADAIFREEIEKYDGGNYAKSLGQYFLRDRGADGDFVLLQVRLRVHTMSGTLLHEELATLQHYLGVDTYRVIQKSSQVIENLVVTKRLEHK